MKVLVGCEFTGTVRREFAKRGHDAWSCDFEPTEISGPHMEVGSHLQCDLRSIPQRIMQSFDLIILHPDCRYLTASGLHWNGRIEGRAEKTEQALEFVRWCLRLATARNRLALENPAIGAINTRIRKPDQKIQPYQFGANASKNTGLWLHHLPPLVPTKFIPGRWVVCNGKDVQRWENQTDSGQNKLSPSETRSQGRARTYIGIAEAMADQWGGLPRL